MSLLRRLSAHAPTILFVLGFGFFCVMFGIASARFEFFPYPLLQRAWSAAQAARNMIFEQGDEAWASGDETRRRLEQSGVIRHDPERALQGLTLYASWDAPAAVVVDMEGELVRRWDLPFSEILAQSNAERAAVPDAEVIVRQARLLPDGDLMAVYERPNHTPYGWGLARFDAEGALRWSVIEHLHHDFALGPAGETYALGQEIRTAILPGLEAVEPPFADEFLVTISPAGDVVDRLSIFEAFANSPFKAALLGLVDLADDRGDYIHPNAVEMITEEIAVQVPKWQAGQVLISLLGMNGFVVIDPERRQVVDFIHGIWHEQHDPDLLANGNILLFDNQGDLAASMHSQVLEVNPTTNEIVWRFPTGVDEPLYSKALGSQQPLANGNVLITESLRGRILEVTRSGDVVWEFLNPVERDGYHAYVLGAQRLPVDSIPLASSPK